MWLYVGRYIVHELSIQQYAQCSKTTALVVSTLGETTVFIEKVLYIKMAQNVNNIWATFARTLRNRPILTYCAQIYFLLGFRVNYAGLNEP